MSKSCSEYLFLKSITAKTPGEIPILNPRTKPPLKYHPVARLERLLNKLLGSWEPNVETFIPYLFRKDHPRVKLFAKFSLDILCDIQVVTGTAIMISGLVRLQAMSFYHQQFVLNYWFLCLSSFWAARAGVLNNQHDLDAWHYWTRTFAIFCSLVLSGAFQVIVLPKQDTEGHASEWNPLRSEKCYLSHDQSIYRNLYFWLAGTFLYAGYLGVLLLSGLTTWRWDYMENLKKKVREREAGYWDAVIRLRDRWMEQIVSSSMSSINPLMVSHLPTTIIPTTIHIPIPRQILRLFVYLIFNTGLFLWYIFTVFLDLIAWGDSDSILLVLAYFGFASWNTYNIIDHKNSNRALLTESETEWGFGQVLPMGMLGLVALNCLDAWKGL